MREIDVRVYAAFALEPELFMALRNANYKFYITPENPWFEFKRAKRALIARFPDIVSDVQPDLMDAIIDMWDDIDKREANRLWSS